MGVVTTGTVVERKDSMLHIPAQKELAIFRLTKSPRVPANRCVQIYEGECAKLKGGME